jgi:hypothetical protein
MFHSTILGDSLMRKIFAYLFVCLLMLSASYGWAQSINSGDIRGTVTDPTGAVVPGTTVTVLNNDTGVSLTFTSNGAGLYDTNSIVPGHYTITFTHAGFEQEVRGPITLEIGFYTLNAKLKLGSDKQVVTVTTDIPLLDTESGQQATTLDSKTMGELPNVGQDWENFVILLPGAVGTPGGSQGSSNPGQAASINGNLPYNNMLTDGASNTLSHSMNAQQAVFENVAEVQINTSAFSAQYGIGGAIFNQVSKAGTSSWHGSVYDYIKNNILEANGYNFNGYNAITKLRYNDFGGSLGGPILKKRLFFYFNYDHIINNAPSGGTASVPTDAILGGNFAGITPLYDPTTQVMKQSAFSNDLYPDRVSFASEYGSNEIPTTLFDPVAKATLAFWPSSSSHIPGKFLPGSTGAHGEPVNNFQSQLVASNPWIQYMGRLDFDITKNNRLTLSDSQQDNPALYLSSVFQCPVNCQNGDQDNNKSQVSDVWQINNHLTNEARIGFTNQESFYTDDALGKGYASKTGWQFAKADDFPEINFADGDWNYAWLDPSSNAAYKQHEFDYSDVVTLITGRHILHFGGELLAYQDNSTAWGNTNAGSFDFGTPGWGFNQNYTAHWSDSSSGPAIDGGGWAFADYLLGLPHSWSASVTPEYGGRFKSPELFVQDDYKITPNLTLNLGLRYQASVGWSEVHYNIDDFDPTVTNPATGTLGAYWYASTAANGRKQLMENTKATFLPRIGFSWLARPRMTVRGAFGVFAYNFSLDNYGGGMGGTFGQSGNAQDTTGFSPIVTLGGNGNEVMPNPKGGVGIGTVTSTPLPYVAASTDPARFNGQGASGQPYDIPVAKILQWNFSVQRELTSNLEAEASYVASHALNLSFPMNINQIPASELLSTGINTAALPYPVYGTNSIGWNTFNAYSNYHSLQLQVKKRMSHGLDLNFNYVFSKLLDEQDSSGWGSREGPQAVQSAYYPKQNYGPSNFDVRQAFKGYVVYKLPFGKGQPFLNNNFIANEIVGGWQVSGTVVLSTGNPFTPAGNQNPNANGSGAYPNWSGNSTHISNRNPRCAVQMQGVGCTNQWYNPEAFSNPGNGHFGNVGRNSLYGPGINTFNLSAHKEFILFEGFGHTVNMQLRADAANAFNHASFGTPSGSLGGDHGAGTVYTSTGGSQAIGGTTVGGRDIQVSAHISF